MKVIMPGQVMSKKNSKRIVKVGRYYKLLPSKAYEAWHKTVMQHLVYVDKVEAWKGVYPIELKIFFYRKTKAIFDFTNMCEGVQDILVETGVIIDDSMKYIVPVIDKRGDRYGWDVDKHNPRVEIKLTVSKKL